MNFILISGRAAELGASVLLSLSENQPEPLESVSQSAQDLCAALTSPDAGGPSAETPHLVSESSHHHSFLSEAHSRAAVPEESLVSADEPPCPSPVDLVPNETHADSCPPQAVEDTQESVCESAGSAHQCDHQHGEEEPEATHLD